jgi:hypothetical protein
MQIHEIFQTQRSAVNEQDFVSDLSSARTQQVQSQQVNQLADMAYKQWMKKLVAMQVAAQGQPIDNDEYSDNLQDFVGRVLLGNKSIDTLDNRSKQRISAAIDGIMRAKDSPQARYELPQAFQELARQASVARQDPAQAKQTQMDINQIVQAAQQIKQQTNQPVGSTGNPSVDALLAALGIPLK